MAVCGRRDVCHAHMTLAEAVPWRVPVHRAPVLATRHFAARRGTSRSGRSSPRGSPAAWSARSQ